MTRSEVAQAIHDIIQNAAHPGPRSDYAREVDAIFRVMGRLSPEPKAKPEPTPLPTKLLKRAKRIKERFEFTDDQKAAARKIINELGFD